MRFLLAVGVLFAVDILLAIALPTREAGAGTAVRLDLPTLVQRSELVVEGRVLSTRVLETDGLLLTEALLEVARTFKGFQGTDEPYVTVRMPGGVRADGSGLLVPGVPGLVEGEELLLFLGPAGRAGMRLPTGLAQGRLELRTAADGTRELVCDTSALALMAGGASSSGTRAVLDYADVVAGIEAALARVDAGR